MVTYPVIGQPTPRVNSEEKATGRARYVAGVSLPGILRGKSLHSTYARIVRTDTTAARQVPGVCVRDLPLTAQKVYRARHGDGPGEH